MVGLCGKGGKEVLVLGSWGRKNFFIALAFCRMPGKAKGLRP
jgi:hypothetical protein